MEITKGIRCFGVALVAPATALKDCSLLFIRFKINNKKHILNLDQFRDILQICPKVGNKKFEEPPFEKEILAFLASLGHSGEIRKITDVNVNNLRLSQAQILWGMYNNKKVDYAYLLWEDFIYQIKNKNTKKGNAMYYPRFSANRQLCSSAKGPSIPRRNKVNWHYARDDPMFTTINVISRNEDTQLYGTILPAELTNEDIRNSESYKEYYAIAQAKIPPMDKMQVRRKVSRRLKSRGYSLRRVLTEAGQLKIITKRIRKETHSSHASGSDADEGTDDQDDDKNDDDENAQYDEDDDKNDDDENAQDDQDDDKNDDDENAQDDEDEAQPESEDVCRNEVEGWLVEGEKSDEDDNIW
ncbi:hypothetical protein Tco_0497596 [Tanacetum coccineum]